MEAAIRYIEGVGLCKVEVLVHEADVRKKMQELDTRIEELFKKAEAHSTELDITEHKRFTICVEGDTIILSIVESVPLVVKSGFAVTFSRKSREGEYSWWNGAWNSPTMYTGSEKVALDEFEQILDAFIAAKEVLEKVCTTDTEREEFTNAFWEHFSIEEPEKAVEKAVREVFRGEEVVE